VIVKAPNAGGNKTTIHFGQDGGFDHTGTLYVVHSTILSPYISPVVDLSAPGAGVSFTNCLVVDPTGSANGQVLVNARNGALMSNAAGHYMWMSSGFSSPAGGTFDHVIIGAAGSLPRFMDAASGNYALKDSAAGIVDAGMDYALISLPQQVSGRQLVAFQVPLGYFSRTFIGKPDIGAYEWQAGTGGVVNRKMPNFTIAKSAGMGIIDLRGRIVSAGSVKDGEFPFASGYYVEQSKAQIVGGGKRVVR
jgi:hypothetical protein